MCQLSQCQFPKMRAGGVTNGQINYLAMINGKYERQREKLESCNVRSQREHVPELASLASYNLWETNTNRRSRCDQRFTVQIPSA